MTCPRCGKQLRETWREKWLNSKGETIISAVGHCEECDCDGTWEIDKDGNEINLEQCFFG